MTYFLDSAAHYFADDSALIDPGTVGLPKIAADQASLGSILNVVYAWAAISAVLVIVIAGLFYTLSRGDAQQVSRAKNAIIGAVIGLVIVMTAFIITRFVLGAAVGTV